MNEIVKAAELAITDGDGVIEDALRHANAPSLLLAVAQLTGDLSLLRPEIQPTPVTMGDEQGGLTEDQQAEIRRIALKALKAYRDGGCQLPPLPSHETLLAMMSYMIHEPVPAEYVPLMIDEMALGGADNRRLAWDRKPAEQVLAGWKVLVIGAGMSGLLTGIRLKQAGIPFEILEKNDAVGGTWHENVYPGCRVDVPNHFYSYAFEPNHDWPKYFSTQAELWAYFDKVATRYGLKEHIRFGTEVVSARWDEARAGWHVVARGKDGAQEVHDARVLVSAVGQLSRPKLPDIKGIERFRGIAFHSAAWRHEHDLAGKRIAVIGTGASAFQFVPEIAKSVGELTVFQRTPPWMFPTDNYHDAVPEGKKWLLKHVPFYANWYRFWLFWTLADALLPALTIDPDWPNHQKSVNAMNDELRVMLTAYIEEQLKDRPDLVAKSIPSYPVGGKRMLRDNGSWLAALKRPNVHLVTEAITEVTETGIRTSDGQERPFDVLIFGTGFKADHFLWPMEIIGKDGIRLNDQWGDDPRAYIGMTVPNFPNLFCLYGPNTNTVHGGSIIFYSECEVRYVMGCLKMLIEGGHKAIEVKRDVHDAFNDRVDAANSTRTWGVPGVSSWYKNRKGRVTQNWPWRLVDFDIETREPKPRDFLLS
jgi:4-hydroxyacetophenone monooxygenase